MSETAKAPFTFQEAIERRIKCTPEQQLADDEFHLSRIMFAFLNPNDNPDGGMLFFRKNDKRDHASWLHEDFKMNEEQFEKVARGYINVLDENGWCRCIIYKGISHSPIEPTEAQLSAIAKLWKTCFPGSPALEIHTGVKIGQIGEIWLPIKYVATYDVAKISRLTAKAYERYKLHWLMTHGYTLNDLIKELQSVVIDGNDPGELDSVTLTKDELSTIVVDAMSYVENEGGFGGEIYACLDEFRGAECTMEDYMKNILGSADFELYKAWLPFIKKDKASIYEGKE